MTDPYIFPEITPDPRHSDWIQLIGHCLDSVGSIYHRDHITVAQSNERIVGILCAVPCGQLYSILSPDQIPSSLKKKIAIVVNGYFEEAFEEIAQLNGLYIMNVCVDSAFRNRGIGKALLESVILAHANESIYLDVVKDNESAVALYEKMGFTILYERMSFKDATSQIPCYFMKRKPE